MRMLNVLFRGACAVLPKCDHGGNRSKGKGICEELTFMPEGQSGREIVDIVWLSVNLWHYWITAEPCYVG